MLSDLCSELLNFRCGCSRLFYGVLLLVSLWLVIVVGLSVGLLLMLWMWFSGKLLIVMNSI